MINKQIDPKHKTQKNFIDIKDLGFIEPEIKPEDYFFGGTTKISSEIINESGQWLDYLPTKESQYKIIKIGDKTYYVETMGCTGFGSNNGWEILHIFLYGEEINLSDRGINILANNTKIGNSPENPMEILRKVGVPFEKSLPYDNTCISWEAFHSPKPLPQNLVNECRIMVEKYQFMHEWVTAGDKEVLWQSLKRSPVPISVNAWKMRNGLYYKEVGESDNHWCVLIGGEYKKFWYIFDTYDNYIKKLEWNYDFKFAKRCYLKKLIDEVPATPNQEENNMQCFQQKGTPELYFKGSGDTKFHYVPEMKMANAIWTQEEIQKRIEMVISPEYIGDTYYRKENILVQIIKLITDFFSQLKGKK